MQAEEICTLQGRLSEDRRSSRAALDNLRELVTLFKGKLAAEKEVVRQQEAVATNKDNIIAILQREIIMLEGLTSTLKEKLGIEPSDA